MIKIAILGACGRMGGMLLEETAADPEAELFAACERSDFPGLGTISTPQGLKVVDQIPDGTQCVIDFTFHAAVPANIARAASIGAAYVLGTTGLSAEEQNAVNAAAEKIPVVQSANYSLGVNLLMELVKRAASVLGDGYDCEITEMHHRLKKDAPSGTALMLAQAAAKGRGVKLDDVAIYGRNGITGERPRGEICIHALRGGMVTGDHTVMFAGDEERVEIVHKAQTRKVFAAGAVRAAKWCCGKKPGIYTMRDVLGFTD